jgi:hypothetical protein
VQRQLEEGNTVTPENVQDWAKQAGLNLSSKEIAEWAELGATMAARTIAQNPKMTLQEKFAAMISLYNRMPTNGERTLDTKQKQQYSTPPPLAFVAQHLADFQNGKIFLEPTAGHGMLMTAGNPEGGYVYNELDENRQERLNEFRKGFGGKSVATNFDATSEKFHTAAVNTKPDRVGMNPPFGAVLENPGT